MSASPLHNLDHHSAAENEGSYSTCKEGRDAVNVDEDGLLHYSPPGSPTWKKKLPFTVPNLLPHGGLLSSAINIAQGALGAGTLGFAAAFRHTGLGIGLFFTVLIAITTVYSLRVLAIVIEEHKVNTFEGLSAKLIHPKAKTVLALVIIFGYWGTTILYTIALGDVLHPLTDSSAFPAWCHGVDGRRAVVALFWFFFMNPLSLLKETNSLRFSSFLGLLTIFLLVFAIVFHAAESTNSEAGGRSDIKWARWDFGMFIALPTISFSYSCQALSFGIYHEMHPRTVGRMTKSGTLAMIVSAIVYLSCGIGGYLNFGEDTKGDILRNYSDPTSRGYLMAAFVGMGLTITVSFPLCIVPTRDSILQLMGYQDVYHTPSLTRIALALFLSLSSLVSGLYVENVSIIFSLCGGIASSSISFIFPALLALRSGIWTVEKVGWLHVTLVYLMLAGGLCTLVLGTIAGCMENL